MTYKAFHLYNTIGFLNYQFNINFANDCIQTEHLWSWKRPLYQLSRNHYPYTTIVTKHDY